MRRHRHRRVRDIVFLSCFIILGSENSYSATKELQRTKRQNTSAIETIPGLDVFLTSYSELIQKRGLGDITPWLVHIAQQNITGKKKTDVLLNPFSSYEKGDIVSELRKTVQISFSDVLFWEQERGTPFPYTVHSQNILVPEQDENILIRHLNLVTRHVHGEGKRARNNQFLQQIVISKINHSRLLLSLTELSIAAIPQKDLLTERKIPYVGARIESHILENTPDQLKRKELKDLIFGQGNAFTVHTIPHALLKAKIEEKNFYLGLLYQKYTGGGSSVEINDADLRAELTRKKEFEVPMNHPVNTSILETSGFKPGGLEVVKHHEVHYFKGAIFGGTIPGQKVPKKIAKPVKETVNPLEPNKSSFYELPETKKAYDYFHGKQAEPTKKRARQNHQHAKLDTNNKRRKKRRRR